MLRQTHVGDGLPVAGRGLNIAALLMVAGMLLDAVIQSDSLHQCFLVASGAGVFRQAIDGKANGIELLLRVLLPPLIVETPIHATIFQVDEMVDEIAFGPTGHFQIDWLVQHPIGCRESPQDAGIEYGSFVSICMEQIVVVNTPIKTAMLIVLHAVNPEAQDIVFQHLPHFLFQYFLHSHFFMG